MPFVRDPDGRPRPFRRGRDELRRQLPRLGQRPPVRVGDRGRRAGASSADRRASRPRALLRDLDAGPHRTPSRTGARAACVARGAGASARRTSRVVGSPRPSVRCRSGAPVPVPPRFRSDHHARRSHAARVPPVRPRRAAAAPSRLRAARPAQRRARLLHRGGGGARAAPVPHLPAIERHRHRHRHQRRRQRGPGVTGRDTGCRRTAVPRVRRSHRPGQGNARAGRVVRSLQSGASRPARARARRRSCERSTGSSRCVPHRCRRRTDPHGDRRRQPRARASVALRELLPRAHGGLGRRQSGRRAGAEPRARGPRSTERWCPAVPQRGGARRSHRSARLPTRAA